MFLSSPPLSSSRLSFSPALSLSLSGSRSLLPSLVLFLGTKKNNNQKKPKKTSWVKKLTRKHITNPALVDLVGDLAAGKLAETIRALAVQVTPESRRSVLVDLLTVYCAGSSGGTGNGKGIVFTQTKREADEVAAALALTVPCEALHGDIAQKARETVLKHFRDGKFSALVATDVVSSVFF